MSNSMFSLGPTHGRRHAVGRAILSLAVALIVCLSAGSAFAQQGDEDVPDGPLGPQLEDYWSVDRDVDVIKNKLYRRKGRFAVGLHAGVMSSQPFFWYIPVGMKLDYYFTDNWGLELEGSFMDLPGVFRHQTDLTNFVKGEKKAAFDTGTDTLDQYKWRAHALAVWHPFYGKLAILQRKLSHFDFNLAAGFGVVSLSRPGEQRQSASDKIVPEFAFGGGVQFFMSDHVTIRLTGRGYLYPGPFNYKNTKSGDRLVSANQNNKNIEETNFFQELELTSEFLLGVSYMF